MTKAGLRHPPQLQLWPPARVQITTPRVQLRLPNETELQQLAEVAGAGVHESEARPFETPWGAQTPTLIARSVVQWHWTTRGTWSPRRWTFDFAVFLDGQPIGVQGLSAVGFPIRREVATGSWLGLGFHRRGFGKEMRIGVLSLAFGQLGAQSAVTGAYEDNTAAIRVSRAVGYHDDGEETADRAGAAVRVHRFRLANDADAVRRWPAVTVTGVDEEVLGLCGARDASRHQALPLGGFPHA